MSKGRDLDLSGQLADILGSRLRISKVTGIAGMANAHVGAAMESAHEHVWQTNYFDASDGMALLRCDCGGILIHLPERDVEFLMEPREDHWFIQANAPPRGEDAAPPVAS